MQYVVKFEAVSGPMKKLSEGVFDTFELARDAAIKHATDLGCTNPRVVGEGEYNEGYSYRCVADPPSGRKGRNVARIELSYDPMEGFIRALERIHNVEIDETLDRLIADIFYETSDRIGEYWVNEQGDSMYIDVEKVAKALDSESLKQITVTKG